MNKIVKTGLLSAAAVGLATAAMAAGATDAQNYVVDVNIVVEKEVSMWANNDNVLLTMDGADGNNSATSESSISVINNVDAKVDALVDGTLPAPIVPGGGINFFIFNSGTAADAVNAITADAYNPAGAKVWNQASLGTSQEIFANVGTNTSIATLPVVYASASPGENPLPNSFDLTVTWTISEVP